MGPQKITVLQMVSTLSSSWHPLFISKLMIKNILLVFIFTHNYLIWIHFVSTQGSCLTNDIYLLDFERSKHSRLISCNLSYNYKNLTMTYKLSYVFITISYYHNNIQINNKNGVIVNNNIFIINLYIIIIIYYIN